MSFFTVRFGEKGVELLDQRRLPLEERVLVLESGEDVAQAITDMVVRGAPAIGVTAAMGVAVELRRAWRAGAGAAALPDVLERVCARLRIARPTAVNLGWAVDQMERALRPLLARGASPEEVAQAACERAQALHDEDVALCRRIGDHGASVIPEGARVLTHCNAGALATAGYGTALGVVRSAWQQGRLARVLASETRPYLQGARLTAWELHRDGIPVAVITDSMAGALMRRGEIDLVVVGADRIAANGDVANKIGTYALAVLARAHGLPLYVAAPLSTVDRETPEGDAIPIEERASSEVTRVGERDIAPPGVPALHPAFDVTPAELVAGIATEAGVLAPPYGPALARAKGA